MMVPLEQWPLVNAVQELGFNYDDPLIGILAVTDFSLNNPTQLAEWEELDIVYLGAYNTPSYVLTRIITVTGRLTKDLIIVA